MYFAYRKGRYVNCTGMTFRVFISLLSYYLMLSHIALSNFVLKTSLFDGFYIKASVSLGSRSDPFMGTNL